LINSLGYSSDFICRRVFSSADSSGFIGLIFPDPSGGFAITTATGRDQPAEGLGQADAKRDGEAAKRGLGWTPSQTDFDPVSLRGPEGAVAIQMGQLDCFGRWRSLAMTYGSKKLSRQILPIRIHFFYQFDFLGSRSGLDLFFPFDSCFDIVKDFVIDQFANVVPAGKGVAVDRLDMLRDPV